MAGLMQQCSYSQNSSSEKNKPTTMENNEQKNSVYSRTDTSKVAMSEDAWKKILPEDVYSIAILKGTERPWSSKFESFNDSGYLLLCRMWQSTL